MASITYDVSGSTIIPKIYNNVLSVDKMKFVPKDFDECIEALTGKYTGEYPRNFPIADNTHAFIKMIDSKEAIGISIDDGCDYKVTYFSDENKHDLVHLVSTLKSLSRQAIIHSITYDTTKSKIIAKFHDNVLSVDKMKFIPGIYDDCIDAIIGEYDNPRKFLIAEHTHIITNNQTFRIEYDDGNHHTRSYFMAENKHILIILVHTLKLIAKQAYEK
jgi:hypothetical protein